MHATITYKLSETGQKAALAAGLSGEKNRSATIEIENADIELFAVDGKGKIFQEAEKGYTKKWGYGDWDDFYFDSVPTGSELIEFLQARKLGREQFEADHAAKVQAEHEAAAALQREKYANFLAQVRKLNADGEFGLPYTPDPPLAKEPEVEEYYRRVKVKEAALNAQAERADNIRRAGGIAQLRPAELTGDGVYRFTCPTASEEKTWAKRLSNVDASQKGGYALEGSWMEAGFTYELPAGELIVVGGKSWHGSKKRGSYEQGPTALYILTPAGLRCAITAETGKVVNVAAQLIAKPPAQRVKDALTNCITTCEKRISNLSALDRTEYVEELADIDARIRSWAELKQACETALASDETNRLASVDAAIEAIITAGSQTLTDQYTGTGEAANLALVAEAKKILLDLLKPQTAAV